MARYQYPPNHQYSRKYEINHNFFDEDNEASFYVAGFIAADGNVSKIDNYIEIRLSTEDEQHLCKIKEMVGATTPFHYKNLGTTKAGDRDITQVSLKFFSKQIKEALKRFNIVPNKTLIYTMPEWLIEHPLVHHFMRGYVDGDGCFWVTSRQYNKMCAFELVGMQNFLERFQNILIKNLGLGKVKIEVMKNSKALKLRYTGNRQTIKIRDFLYKDATIYLERKFNIVNGIEDIIAGNRQRYEKRLNTYEFLDPSGNKVIVNALRQFCIKNNLDCSSMVKIHKGKVKQHKGWRKSIEKPICS